MGCIEKENYIGEIIEMPKSKKSSRNQQVIQISLGGILGIIVTIVIAALGATWMLANSFADVNKDIAVLNSRMDNVDAELKNIHAEIDEMHDYLYNDGGVKDQLGILTKDLNEITDLLHLTTVIATADVSNTVNSVSVEPNDRNMARTNMSAATCLGEGLDGERYLAGDLVGEKILLTYIEDGKEVYFLGQYNDSYHWDGYCVTNVYESDGTLYGVCESNFKDGKRLDYKSLYRRSGDNWIYSDKVCNDDGNYGVNVSYVINNSQTKNFTNTDVRITDIVYADTAIPSDARLCAFYHGNTEDGRYNDDTGKAYEVILNEDGTVRTLYVGKFQNGTFNDDTGNAWDVAFVDEGGYYVHNTGIFREGHAVKRSTTPIDIVDIAQILADKGMEIDIELKWAQEAQE